ncbi:MAG: amine oxidase, partial [Cyanobacteria bacterium J06555_12]
QRDLATCVPEFASAKVIDRSVIRVQRGVTHFSPGSYQYLMSANTSYPNVFMSGDWIVNRHGSWSQEKALVTGLEAANWVVRQLGQGESAHIIPIEPDEPHIEALRSLNRTGRAFARDWLPKLGTL